MLLVLVLPFTCWRAPPSDDICAPPLSQHHAQLLAAGELLPGVAAAEFAQRRRALADALPPGGLALLPSAPQVFMAGVSQAETEELFVACSLCCLVVKIPLLRWVQALMSAAILFLLRMCI